MAELYLILHKVRGEPTFDIATPLQIGDEEGWIIPTSGHRAYPWFFYKIDALMYEAGIIVDVQPDFIGDWPDHYPPKSSPAESKASANDLLSALGLPTKVHSAVSGTLKRRI